MNDYLLLRNKVLLSSIYCKFCNRSSYDSIRDSSFMIYPFIVVKKNLTHYTMPQ